MTEPSRWPAWDVGREAMTLRELGTTDKRDTGGTCAPPHWPPEYVSRSACAGTRRVLSSALERWTTAYLVALNVVCGFFCPTKRRAKIWRARARAEGERSGGRHRAKRASSRHTRQVGGRDGEHVRRRIAQWTEKQGIHQVVSRRERPSRTGRGRERFPGSATTPTNPPPRAPPRAPDSTRIPRTRPVKSPCGKRARNPGRRGDCPRETGAGRSQGGRARSCVQARAPSCRATGPRVASRGAECRRGCLDLPVLGSGARRATGRALAPTARRAARRRRTHLAKRVDAARRPLGRDRARSAGGRSLGRAARRHWCLEKKAGAAPGSRGLHGGAQGRRRAVERRSAWGETLGRFADRWTTRRRWRAPCPRARLASGPLAPRSSRTCCRRSTRPPRPTWRPRTARSATAWPGSRPKWRRSAPTSSSRACAGSRP